MHEPWTAQVPSESQPEAAGGHQSAPAARNGRGGRRPGLGSCQGRHTQPGWSPRQRSGSGACEPPDRDDEARVRAVELVSRRIGTRRQGSGQWSSGAAGSGRGGEGSGSGAREPPDRDEEVRVQAVELVSRRIGTMRQAFGQWSS